MIHHENAARALIAAGTLTLALVALALIVAGLYRVHATRAARADEPTEHEGATEGYADVLHAMRTATVSTALLAPAEQMQADHDGLSTISDAAALFAANMDAAYARIMAPLSGAEQVRYLRSIDKTGEIDMRTLGRMLAAAQRDQATQAELDAMMSAELVGSVA